MDGIEHLRQEVESLPTSTSWSPWRVVVEAFGSSFNLPAGNFQPCDNLMCNSVRATSFRFVASSTSFTQQMSLRQDQTMSAAVADLFVAPSQIVTTVCPSCAAAGRIGQHVLLDPVLAASPQILLASTSDLAIDPAAVAVTDIVRDNAVPAGTADACSGDGQMRYRLVGRINKTAAAGQHFTAHLSNAHEMPWQMEWWTYDDLQGGVLKSIDEDFVLNDCTGQVMLVYALV